MGHQSSQRVEGAYKVYIQYLQSACRVHAKRLAERIAACIAGAAAPRCSSSPATEPGVELGMCAFAA